MRILWFVLLFLVLSTNPGFANISVSPVIIESAHIRVGDTFEILCQNWQDDEIEVQLSLALFDQDGGGSVFFLENAENKQRAKETLWIEEESFDLKPQGQKTIRVQVQKVDFDHLYAVLFVKPKQIGVQTRFAVLFLLSASGHQADMSVVSWEQKEQALALIVQNSGLSHGLWQGELLCFDAGDRLAETRSVASGVVLAGRSRGVEVGLPGWVARVEILPKTPGR